MEREFIKQSTGTRNLLLALGLIIGTFILNGANAQKLENSLLWEVSGKGVKTSYVYGTFHLMPQADFELKENVKTAFSDSEQIVMELDMDNPGMQAELMQNLAMKDGQSIDQLMNEEDYGKLDEYLKKSLSVGLDQMKTFKPFFIASMLLPTMIEGTPASYEMTFVQMALDQEKEILGLETPTFQAQVFDKSPYKDQVEDLLDMVYQSEDMGKLFDQMIEHYKREDGDEMYLLMTRYMDSENEEKYLITERNTNWIPKIGEYSRNKSTFFAVGAGHLGGEQGVINLLRKEGYKVKPVKK